MNIDVTPAQAAYNRGKISAAFRQEFIDKVHEGNIVVTMSKTNEADPVAVSAH